MVVAVQLTYATRNHVLSVVVCIATYVGGACMVVGVAVNSFLFKWCHSEEAAQAIKATLDAETHIKKLRREARQSMATAVNAGDVVAAARRMHV